MEEASPGVWVQPVGGYKPPDQSCVRCFGLGSVVVRLPEEDEFTVLWIGRCPTCGAENGGLFQRSGAPSPLEDSWERRYPPVCINSDCPTEHVAWVTADTIECSWIAVCPICSIGHWADFLELVGGEAPTESIQPRSCPQCSYAPMTWQRVDDLA